MIWKSGWYSIKDKIHLLLDGEENSHIKMLSKIYRFNIEDVWEDPNKTEIKMKQAFDDGFIRFGYIKYNKINDIGQLYIEGSKKFVNDKYIYDVINIIKDILLEAYNINDIEIIDYSNDKDINGYQNYKRLELERKMKL